MLSKVVTPIAKNSNKGVNGPVDISLADIEAWALKDFRSSGISDEMIEINMAVLQGADAIDDFYPDWMFADRWAKTNLIHGCTATKDKKRQLPHPQVRPVKVGGWAPNQSPPYKAEWEPSFKPIQPRSGLKDPNDISKGTKLLKYEAPKGGQGHPLFPSVTWEVGSAIAQRYNLLKAYMRRHDFGEGDYDRWFWDFVERNPKIPVAITEGFKKAVLLTQQGYPAIAARSISLACEVGNAEKLRPQLAMFTNGKRQITVVFDQDLKPTTVKNVVRASLKIARCVDAAGCVARLAVWHTSEGKGVDDAFVAVADGQAWLDAVMAGAITLGLYEKDRKRSMTQNAIARLKELPYKPVRDTRSSGYLEELPKIYPGSGITVIQANQGSGKTYRIGQDIVRHWVDVVGGIVIVPGMLNSLGQQTAKIWGIPHCHDYSREQLAVWAADFMVQSGGGALCFDSMFKIPQEVLSGDRPLLIVVDEANQAMDHLAGGSTLGARHSETLALTQKFFQKAGANGAIVLSESGVHGSTVEYVKALSGVEHVSVYSHHREGGRYDYTMAGGNVESFCQSELFKAVERGERVAVLCDSQRQGEIIDRRCHQLFPGKNIVRVDGVTNEASTYQDLFSDPDQWLEANQPDVFIASPTMKTGVSIEWKGFSRVVAIFQHLDSGTHAQMLCRVRTPVERFIFCPVFLMLNKGEMAASPQSILQGLAQKQRELAAAYQMPVLEADPVTTATAEFYAARLALRGNQKSIARQALIDALTIEGHNCKTLALKGQAVHYASALSERTFPKISDQIDQEFAKEIAGAEPFDSALQIKRAEGRALKRGEQMQLIKTRLIEQYPGYDFDDPKKVYFAYAHNRRGFARAADLAARSANQPQSRLEAKAFAEAILGDPSGANWRLPTGVQKAAIVQATGILELVEHIEQNPDEVYDSSHPLLIKIAADAQRWSNALRDYFRLTIKDGGTDNKKRRIHTPVDICNKLLRLVGWVLTTSTPDGSNRRVRRGDKSLYQYYARNTVGRSTVQGVVFEEDLDEEIQVASARAAWFELRAAAEVRLSRVEIVEEEPIDWNEVAERTKIVKLYLTCGELLENVYTFLNDGISEAERKAILRRLTADERTILWRNGGQ